MASATLTKPCLLYTSDAADDLLCVDLGGRRLITKKNKNYESKSVEQRQKPCEHKHATHAAD